MRTLHNTQFEFIYKWTSSSTDEEFLSKFTTLMCLGIIGTALQSILLGPLPYGKGNFKSANSKKSFLQILSVNVNSKAAFRYAFLPTASMPFLVYFLTPSNQIWNFSNWFGISLFTFHYIHRSIIFTSKISSNASPTPLLLFIMLSMLATSHAFYQSHHLLNVLSIKVTPLTFLGVIMAIVGFKVNQHHDYILTSLREKDDTKGGSSQREYKIPTGGLFEYVSCANYFGEIVEWWGLFVVTFGVPQAMLAVFTTVLLGLRARFAHNFYKQKFGNSYPSTRKAIIPFIY